MNDLSNNNNEGKPDELDDDLDLEPIILFDNWERMPNLSIPAVAKDDEQE